MPGFHSRDLEKKGNEETPNELPASRFIFPSLSNGKGERGWRDLDQSRLEIREKFENTADDSAPRNSHCTLGDFFENEKEI